MTKLDGRNEGRKIARHLSQDMKSLRQDLNPGHCVHEAEVQLSAGLFPVTCRTYMRGRVKTLNMT
jgi:hypothetical protein